jgi:hypothetical protein
VVVAASLAILGCTGTTPGSECGGAGEACCAGNVCSGALVCGAAGQCNAAGPTYTIGGLVSGLTGTGLALRNGAETLAIHAAGAFSFATALPAGSAYAVTIATQPSGQSCTVANGSGTVGSANVTSVAVSCTSPPATTYTIGGTVSGLTGTGLVLQDNRADNLPIAASGAFTFATALTQGDLYTVTVLSQPTGQTCSVAKGGHGSGVTYLLYDVAGASASSFDGYTFRTLYDNPTGSDVFDSPVITPLTAPGLTITATAFGQGPSSGLGPGCPAGAIFDFVYYTGETDLDTMDNADFRAHVFNTDTSTQHWNIAVANGNIDTNVSSLAVHFK